MTRNERIKMVRRELKLSQTKFAKGISISNGYIAGLELGNRTVNDRLVKLIVSAYGVNERWLRDGEGEMFTRAGDDKTERLLRCFKELQPEFQDYLLHQIDQLLDLQEKTETHQ